MQLQAKRIESETEIDEELFQLWAIDEELRTNWYRRERCAENVFCTKPFQGAGVQTEAPRQLACLAHDCTK
jgi:hypothetical protein